MTPPWTHTVFGAWPNPLAHVHPPIVGAFHPLFAGGQSGSPSLYMPLCTCWVLLSHAVWPMNAFDQVVSPQPISMDRLTFERLPVCWISGFTDWTRTGAVASAHIIDQVLLPKGDPRRYDPAFRLSLRVDIHALFDARVITVLPDGSIATALTDGQLSALGISRASCLNPIVCTDRRMGALGQRIIDHDKFAVAKGIAMQNNKGAAI